MLVTYLAHDLDDPSIWRRVEMLRRGGATVRVAGFRRAEGALPGSATVLGRTANGQMVQRLWAVAKTLPRMARLVPAPGAQTPEVVLARNLEMLMLGAALQRRRPVRLIYELLDIHAMMLGRGAKSRGLRALEAGLMRKCALVVVSSPAFVSRYLQAFGQPSVSTLLVENKPFADVIPDAAPEQPQRPDRRLRIGWFGMLRCSFSLMALDRLTRAQPGRYQVMLRGRPALDVVPEFHAVVAANSDLDFKGPYRWPEDLAAIYGEVDMAWLIDRYQAGQNSDWLLPNRLYEGCLNNAVPVVLQGTEVARRVQDWGCGVVLSAPDDDAIRKGLDRLDAAQLRAFTEALGKIPRHRLRMNDAECVALTRNICGTGNAPSQRDVA